MIELILKDGVFRRGMPESLGNRSAAKARIGRELKTCRTVQRIAVALARAGKPIKYQRLLSVGTEGVGHSLAECAASRAALFPGVVADHDRHSEFLPQQEGPARGLHQGPSVD